MSANVLKLINLILNIIGHDFFLDCEVPHKTHRGTWFRDINFRALASCLQLQLISFVPFARMPQS